MRNYNNLPKIDTPYHITDLRHMVSSMAERFGDKVMYRYKEKGELKTLTYEQCRLRHDCFGTALFELGLAGKNIAVIGEPHPDWMIAFWAVANCGGVIVPLDKECCFTEIEKFLSLSHCSAVVYTELFNGKFSESLDELPEIEYLIPITPDGTDFADAPDKTLSFDRLVEIGGSLLDGGDKRLYSRDIDMDAMCALFFTSGTTGSSKGVMLSQKNLTAAANSSAQSMQYDSRNEMVSVLPFHHTYELTCCHNTGLGILGGSVFLNDSLKHASRNFIEQKPLMMLLVPLFVETVYKKIWDEIRKKGIEKKVRSAMALSDGLLKLGIDLRPAMFSDITKAFGGRMKSMVVGGASLDPKISRDFYSFGITILQGYGITECSPLVAVNRPGHIKHDSVGWVVENCEVKLGPIEGGENGEGEILVKGDNVMLGYYNDPEATAAVFTEDGWFRTGDIGRIDKDGYIMITGRKKNVIIMSNGKNIYPEEIEEHLMHLSYLKEFVVIGRENSKKEPTIMLVAVPNRDIVGDESVDSIAARLKKDVAAVNRSLPPYKHINGVEVREEEFEKTPSLKIKRYLIK